MLRRKNYAVTSFKALPDLDGVGGRFEAIVSVFGNVDLQGDRVVKGAFDKNIKEWRDSGDPIPVIWSHDWGNPFAHIGKADPQLVEEVDEGLKVIGEVDMDDPFAAQVYKLMKERRVKEFSFAYDIVKEKTARDRANELEELKIIEVGPTLKGANPATELLDVKSRLEDAAHESEGEKGIYEPLPGSTEERQRAVQGAVNEWRDERYPADSDGRRDTYAYVAATFDNRVIVCVESYGDEETKYFEIDYTVDDENQVELGDEREVEVTIGIAPASGEASRPAPDEPKAADVDIPDDDLESALLILASRGIEGKDAADVLVARANAGKANDARETTDPGPRTMVETAISELKGTLQRLEEALGRDEPEETEDADADGTKSEPGETPEDEGDDDSLTVLKAKIEELAS